MIKTLLVIAAALSGANSYYPENPAPNQDGHLILKPTDRCVRIISPQQKIYSRLTYSDGSNHYRYPQLNAPYAQGGSPEGIFPTNTTLRVAGLESLIASNPVTIENCAQQCTVTRLSKGWLSLRCEHPKCPTKKNSNKLKRYCEKPKF